MPFQPYRVSEALRSFINDVTQKSVIKFDEPCLTTPRTFCSTAELSTLSTAPFLNLYAEDLPSFQTYPSHNSNRFQRQEPRVTNFIVDNRIKYFLFIVTWERRLKFDKIKLRIIKIMCSNVHSIAHTHLSN